MTNELNFVSVVDINNKINLINIDRVICITEGEYDNTIHLGNDLTVKTKASLEELIESLGLRKIS